jgi:hypothetical protein
MKVRARKPQQHASEVLAQWKNSWFLLADWSIDDLEFEAQNMQGWTLSVGNEISRMFGDVVYDIARARKMIAEGNHAEASICLVRAGLGMGIAMSVIGGIPKSPGRPHTVHWGKAEEIFKNKVTQGKRVTQGKLWIDCKNDMQAAGIDFDSFKSQLNGKEGMRQKWLKELSGKVKP